MAYHIATGDDDLDGYVIRHDRDCNLPGCVNPAHLLKGTQDDNMRDLALAGNSTLRKLTPAAVLEIDELIEQNWSDAEIAEDYPVGRTAVANIRSGYRWGWLTGR